MNVKNKKAYEPDNGELTAEQIERIRSESSATATPDEAFTERLF